jgi:hypothetical protein
MIPTPWVAAVLALGAFRLVRLVGWDDFPLALRLRRWATGETVYRTPTEGRERDLYRYTRPTLEHFLTCPFCVGFWISLAVYGSWLVTPTWTTYALAPFALSAAVGLTAKNLDP